MRYREHLVHGIWMVYEAERHRPAPPAFFDQQLVKAHSSERPTDFSPNVSEKGLVKAHSFQILGEK